MRYEISGFISDTHSDPIDVTPLNNDPEDAAQYVPGPQTITVHSGRGSIELPWDAHPMLKVGTRVTLAIEVEA